MPRPGSTHQRGYGRRHQLLRQAWAPRVAAGRVVCNRCDQLIKRGQDWDLGHDDSDPNHRTYAGPEHQACNRAAGAAKGRANHADPQPTPRTRW